MLLAALGLGPSPGAHAVDVMGDSVEIAWSPASGDVAGYYLIVARNGAAASVEGYSVDTQETLSGAIGDSLVVQVAAYGPDGVAGPSSPPSEPIAFVADDTPPPPPSDPPGDGTTGDDPPSGEEGGTDTGDPPPTPVGAGIRHDLTCDGFSDLLVQGADGHHSVWELRDGGFVREIPLAPAPAGTVLAGAGDYDGNGCADLLWQDRNTRRLHVWLLGSDGAVASARWLESVALPTEEAWQVAGSADVDGDGTDDIALHSAGLGQVELWLMDRGDVAETQRFDGHGHGWEVPALSDTDGDELAELIWYYPAGDWLERLEPLTDEDGPFLMLVPDWRPIGAGDFDGDGLDELFVHNQASGGSVVVARPQDKAASGRGAGPEIDFLPSALGFGLPVGFGDYDGDGLDDIAWMDIESGSITVWLEMGERSVAAGQLPAGARIAPALGSP